MKTIEVTLVPFEVEKHAKLIKMTFWAANEPRPRDMSYGKVTLLNGSVHHVTARDYIAEVCGQVLLVPRAAAPQDAPLPGPKIDVDHPQHTQPMWVLSYAQLMEALSGPNSPRGAAVPYAWINRMQKDGHPVINRNNGRIAYGAFVELIPIAHPEFNLSSPMTERQLVLYDQVLAANADAYHAFLYVKKQEPDRHE